MILVSACLAGLACRYDGSDCADAAIISLIKAGLAVAACPERLGGLVVPRDRAEIVGGNGLDVLEKRAVVLSQKGVDLTAEFVRGASVCVEIAAAHGCATAILKENSPSCGVRYIYDGSFSAKITNGFGVAAAALARVGVGLRSNIDNKNGGRP